MSVLLDALLIAQLAADNLQPRLISVSPITASGTLASVRLWNRVIDPGRHHPIDLANRYENVGL